MKHAMEVSRLAIAVAMMVAGPASSAIAQPAQAVPLVQTTPSAALQGFSVVLVIGEMGGSQSPGADVPAAARRALEDMKDFLPYKSYRLLDTAWMAGSLPVRSAATKIRGPNNRDLNLLIVANTTISTVTVQPEIGVKFSLSDPGGRQAGTDSLENRARELERAVTLAERDIRELEKATRDAAALARAREKYELLVRQYREARSQIAATEQAQAFSDGRPSPVIDTSFNMEIGETVVVGTSRLQGDTALIALLTAVPREAR